MNRCYRRTYNASLFHIFNHPCGAVVSDLKTPLHTRDRGLAAFRDKADRFVIKRIRLLTSIASASRTSLSAATKIRGILIETGDFLDIIAVCPSA